MSRPSLDSLPLAAREAILAQLEQREPRACAAPRTPSAPVFVTLRLDGKLRGCMGVLTPRHGDIVAETMDRARAAAFEDQRFPPVTLEELMRCEIEVAILGRLEAIGSQEDLDPARYGIVVSDAVGRRGVLLPGIDGVDRTAQQIAIARRKAGIPEDSEITIRRFEVEKDGAGDG